MLPAIFLNAKSLIENALNISANSETVLNGINWNLSGSSADTKLPAKSLWNISSHSITAVYIAKAAHTAGFSFLIVLIFISR